MNTFRHALAVAVLVLFAGLQPAAAQMDALMKQGGELLNANDPHGAISPLTQGLAIAESRGIDQAIGDFAQNLGLAYDYDKQPNLAIRYYDQAIGVYRRIGDKPDLLWTLGNLGIVYKNKGENVKSLELQTEALSLARALGDKSAEGRALGNIGNIYSEFSNSKEALDYHTKALTLQTSLDEKLGIAIDLQAISSDYQALGEYAKALDYSKRAFVAFG